MPTLDMRPSVTPNEGGDESEEVKEATALVEAEKPAAESSPAEQTTSDEVEAEAVEPEAEAETEPEKTGDEDEAKVETALRSTKADLLKEIEDLRATRRAERSNGAPIIVPAVKRDEPVSDLSDVNENDVKLIEKVLRAKGYVRKDEVAELNSSLTYKEKMDAEKDAWLAKHPEYLPANDPDDKRWNALNQSITAYFKAPANPKDIAKVMDAAHVMLSPIASPMPVKTKASTDAAKEKVNSSSRGAAGGSKASSPVKKSSVDLSRLEGFTQEELDEMGA